MAGTSKNMLVMAFRIDDVVFSLQRVIDASHFNDEDFWDLVRVASEPLIASHSNCRALAPTMRNLSDEQIGAIAGSGGVVGLSSIETHDVIDSHGGLGPLRLN